MERKRESTFVFHKEDCRCVSLSLSLDMPLSVDGHSTLRQKASLSLVPLISLFLVSLNVFLNLFFLISEVCSI